MILILYLVVFESGYIKNNRLKWIIAKALHLDKARVGVESGGNVTITGQRTTAVDNLKEEVSYHVNIFDWLTFKNSGYINRNRGVVEGKDYGHVVYPVKYNENGTVTMQNYNEKTIEGRRDSKGIGMNWNDAEGTGIRDRQVFGHDDQGTRSKNDNIEKIKTIIKNLYLKINNAK